ncbi:MAG: hypothetical protein DMG09_00580, partial [Acidobacteria bacterium]
FPIHASQQFDAHFQETGRPLMDDVFLPASLPLCRALRGYLFHLSVLAAGNAGARTSGQIVPGL